MGGGDTPGLGSCPPPTPHPQVVGEHSRLTLMLVFRLEVVRPVVCWEGREGHVWPSLGPGSPHPNRWIQTELLTPGGQALTS